jgi:sporulation protein YlmC with PRC-barrel domain
MRLDKLRKRTVVDPQTGTRLGTVTDYLVDATAGRVAVLIVHPVEAELSQPVSADRVLHVGQDAVILSRSTGTGASAPLRSDLLDRRHLRGLIAFTDTGKRLGRVEALDVDTTLKIQNFKLAAPIWRRWLWWRKNIAAASVAWCGRDVLVVRTDAGATRRPVGHEDSILAALSDLTATEQTGTPAREHASPV